MNPASIHEDMGLISGLAQWAGSGVAISYSISCRCSSDLALLWLWCKPASAVPIGPLAWELPYATHVALKRQKKKKKIN